MKALTLMRTMNLALCCLSMTSIAPAMADGYPQPGYPGYPGNGWASCSTRSNGYQFRNADYGIENARVRTVNDCTRAVNTNDGQCRYNAQCDGEMPGYYARCSTNSNGYQFFDGSPDSVTGLQRVMDSCARAVNTNDGTCRYNARCEGGAPLYVTRCSTTSNGYRFFDAALDAQQAMQLTLNACIRAVNTNDGQCRANLRCENPSGQPGYPQPQPPYYPPQPQPQPPYYPPQPQPQPPYYPPQPQPPHDDDRQYVCSTRSNGREFSVPGRGYQRTRAKVVAVCQQSGYTNHYECDRNAYCQ